MNKDSSSSHSPDKVKCIFPFSFWARSSEFQLTYLSLINSLKSLLIPVENLFSQVTQHLKPFVFLRAYTSVLRGTKLHSQFGSPIAAILAIDKNLPRVFTLLRMNWVPQATQLPFNKLPIHPCTLIHRLLLLPIVSSFSSVRTGKASAQLGDDSSDIRIVKSSVKSAKMKSW